MLVVHGGVLKDHNKMTLAAAFVVYAGSYGNGRGPFDRGREAPEKITSWSKKLLSYR
jgi:hypothetical protein